jgi:hypothetical protein
MPPSSNLTRVDRVDSTRPMKPSSGPSHCRATVRRTGEQCRRYPIRGGTVCPSHGGAAPQVRNAARRREVTAGAAALVAREGYRSLDDPVEALLDTAAEMIALKDALANQVAALTVVTVTDRTGAENVAAVLAAYERGLERVAKVLVSMNRLDIAARKVNVEEKQAEILAQALRRAVFSDRARLDFDTAMTILAIASDEFTALMVGTS